MIAFAAEARVALGILVGSLVFTLLVARFIREGKGRPVEMLGHDLDDAPDRHDPAVWLDVERRARRTAEAQAQIDAARNRTGHDIVTDAAHRFWDTPPHPRATEANNDQ